MSLCCSSYECKFLTEKTSRDVANECNLLEVLRCKKVVTGDEAISTKFSTDCVEKKDLDSEGSTRLLSFQMLDLAASIGNVAVLPFFELTVVTGSVVQR